MYDSKVEQEYGLLQDTESRGSGDESLAGIVPPELRLNERRPWVASFAWLSTTLMATAVGVFIGWMSGTNFNGEARHPSLLKTPVPNLGEEIVRFQPNTIYSLESTAESDKAWHDLIPESRGYIYVNDYERYDLEQGEDTGYGDIFCVAFYHQLHCLDILRKNQWSLLSGILEGQESSDLREEAKKQRSNPHNDHCYDYLRQSIECAADMTLEWPMTEIDGRRDRVWGWGVPHVCKKKESIVEFMEHNGFNGSRRMHA